MMDVIVLGRQLQHAGALALMQKGQLDDPAVGQFDRVMVGMRIVEVHLAEAGEARVSHAVAHPGLDVVHHIAPEAVVANRLLEREFGAGQQAHGDARLVLRAETPGRRHREAARYQLVADFGGTADLILQAVVAHRNTSERCEPSGPEPFVRSGRTSRHREGS
jgi:hypothetical protein